MLVYKEIDSGISGIGMIIVTFAHLPNLEFYCQSIMLKYRKVSSKDKWLHFPLRLLIENLASLNH